MNRHAHRGAVLAPHLFLLCISAAACRSRTVSKIDTDADKTDSEKTVVSRPLLSQAVASALGDRWKVYSRKDEMIIERKPLPKIYNMFSPNPHDIRLIFMTEDTEIRAATIEKYRVNIPYQIILRQGPRLGDAEVARRLQGGRAVGAALDDLSDEGIVPHLKMPVQEEERIRAAWNEFEEIPCGTYRARSVYIYLSNFRAAHTDAAANTDYYSAALRIAALLEPYKSVRLRRGLNPPIQAASPHEDDTCEFNLFAPLISLSCPW